MKILFKINTIDEDLFAKLLQKQMLRSRCQQLDIKDLQDIKMKSKEYFERFEYNELRDIIFRFYQKYIEEKENLE